jgi:hypothetical protein
MLETGVCVFCFYGINQWDSNGSVVNKSEAIDKFDGVFNVWRDYFSRYHKDLKRAISILPKGTVVTKRIKGNNYKYLVYRDKKIKFKYLGKIVPGKLILGITKRRDLVKKMNKMRPLFYSLGIIKRPSSRIDRFSILERDGFACQYCGRKIEDGVKLHIDHIIPLSKGGTDAEGNLTTSCEDCNLNKHSKLLRKK